jgi:hypothetical protein
MRSIVCRALSASLLAVVLLAAGCGSNQGTGLLVLSISADPTNPPPPASKVVLTLPGGISRTYPGSFPPASGALVLEFPNLPASDSPVTITVQAFDSSGCVVGSATKSVTIAAGVKTTSNVTLAKSTGCGDGGILGGFKDGGEAGSPGEAGAPDGAGTAVDSADALVVIDVVDATAVDASKDTPPSVSAEAGAGPDAPAAPVDATSADGRDAPAISDAATDSPIAIGGASGSGGAGGGGATSSGVVVGSGGTVAGGATVAGGSSTGGAIGSGGTASGGSTASGGVIGAGGAVIGATVASGGAPVMGGTTSSGGAPATGGATFSGGAPATGGATPSGGAPVTGGTTSSGGTTTCNGTSCPSGCCQNGACEAYGSQTVSMCGTSGAACGACTGGQTCQSGTCACPSGSSWCNGYGCANTQNDFQNCGTCGHGCTLDCTADNSSVVQNDCVLGVCTPTTLPCPSTQYCVAATCAEKKKTGDPCDFVTSGYECLSGVCGPGNPLFCARNCCQ